MGCKAFALRPADNEEDVHIIEPNKGQLIYQNNPYKLGEASSNFCVEYAKVYGGEVSVLTGAAYEMLSKLGDLS